MSIGAFVKLSFTFFRIKYNGGENLMENNQNLSCSPFQILLPIYQSLRINHLVFPQVA